MVFGWIARLLHGWSFGCLHSLMVLCRDGLIVGCLDAWKFGWLKGLMVGCWMVELLNDKIVGWLDLERWMLEVVRLKG